MGKSEKCLLIFTKNPILGTAKTRIGKVKGDEIALKVYKKLLKYTRDFAQDFDGKKVVYFNQFIEEKGIWDAGFEKRMQGEGNLGQKMGAAFREEMTHSDKVVIIGSDCATLNREDIEEAFLKLEEHDLVLGPADDGGYYLLGMKNYVGYIFEDMPWSQENLLDETLSRIKANKLSYALLRKQSDIDFWEDWVKLDWELD